MTRAEIFAKHNVPEEKQAGYLKQLKSKDRAFLETFAKDCNIQIPPKCSRTMLDLLILDYGLAANARAEEKLRKRMDTKQRHADQFRRFFGVGIHKFYSHPMLGFDVVTFDEQIVKPEKNETTKECLIRKWGHIAATMIEELIQ